MFVPWDQIYEYLGITEFIYFVASPSIQETLFPIKVVFYFFSLFFFCALMWFYVNSSYMEYSLLKNASDFLARDKGSGASRSWKKIKKRMEVGTESELKLAMIEADDLLYEALSDAGVDGTTFEELVSNATKKASIAKEDILQAHAVRNLIVYEDGYKLDVDTAKRMLATYEIAIKTLS